MSSLGSKFIMNVWIKVPGIGDTSQGKQGEETLVTRFRRRLSNHKQSTRDGGIMGEMGTFDEVLLFIDIYCIIHVLKW